MGNMRAMLPPLSSKEKCKYSYGVKPSLSMKTLSINDFINKLLSKLLRNLSNRVHLKCISKFISKSFEYAFSLSFVIGL